MEAFKRYFCKFIKEASRDIPKKNLLKTLGIFNGENVLGFIGRVVNGVSHFDMKREFDSRFSRRKLFVK